MKHLSYLIKSSARLLNPLPSNFYGIFLFKYRIVATSLLMLGLTQVLSAQPQIRLDPEELELEAELRPGDWGPPVWHIEHPQLWVINEGDEVLRVNAVEADVEWLYADPDEFEVAPDQRQRIRFDISEHFDRGEYDIEVTLSSNDPDNEEVILPVHAVLTIYPLWIDPWWGAFEFDLRQGEEEHLEINATNVSEEPIRYFTEFVVIREPDRDNNQDGRLQSVSPSIIIRRDDPGDILDEFRHPRGDDECLKYGFAWEDENSLMLLICEDQRWVSGVNPRDDYEVEWEFQPRQEPIGITCLNGVIYVSEIENERFLREYDIGGGYIGNLDLRFFPGSLTSDSENELIFIAENEENFPIYVIAEDGDEVGLIENLSEFLDDIQNSDIYWVPRHWNGKLWVRNGEELWQLAVDEEEWQVTELVQTIHLGRGRNGDGFGHDGANLWIGYYDSQGVAIIDDGLDEHPFIEINPESGEIEPDEDATIIITVDAFFMDEGDYEFEVYLLTNNPDAADFVFPITVHVIAFQQRIELDPENIEIRGYFGGWDDDWWGPPGFFEIINRGGQLLRIESIEADVEWLRFEPDHLLLAPLSRQEIEVWVEFDEPPDRGEYDAVITINSNDEDNPELELPVLLIQLEPPRIVVEPEDGFDELLLTGIVEDFALRIGNEGGAPLRFFIEYEVTAEPERDILSRQLKRVDQHKKTIPQRDDPGDVLDEFDIPHGGADRYNAGLAWDEDNGWMWITEWAEPFRVMAIEPEDYEIAQQFRAPSGCKGAAWIDGVLYLVNWDNRYLLRYSTEGRNLGNMNLGFTPTAVASDPESELLFVMDAEGDRDIHVLITEGEEVGRISDYRRLIDNQESRSICLVSEHREGQLWLNTTSRAWQLEVDTDDWEAVEQVQNFATFSSSEWDGIGHDGWDLWLTSFRADRVRIVDDGTIEFRWILIVPLMGEIEPDEELNIIITLDARNIRGGDYEALLYIYSNDPENPEIEIPIIMSIDGFNYWIEWSEDWGFPDVLDFNAAFGDIYTQIRYTLPINIWNCGWDDFEAEDIFCDNECFSVQPDQFVLESDEEIEVMITFYTDEAGEFEGTITFVTNDPDHEEIVIPVRAEAQELVLRHYTDFEETEFSHNLTVEDVTFLWETAPTGFEVGVFTEDDILAGGGLWIMDEQLELTAFGDDPDTDITEGFARGEEFTFRLWDYESDEEYNTDCEFIDGPEVWTNEGESIITIDAFSIITQTIEFKRGWNLISFNIIPDGEFANFQELFEDQFRIEDDEWILISIKDEHGNFCNPRWRYWGIERLTYYEGYQCNISEDIDAEWTGIPINPQEELIGLDEGWNLIAYFPDYNLPAEFYSEDNENNYYVINEIIDYVILAKDGRGCFMAPRYDFSNMEPWRAGQGYQINLDEEIEGFRYPEPMEERNLISVNHVGLTVTHNTRSVNRGGLTVSNSGRWSSLPSTGENMSVLVTSVVGLDVENGDQIAAFNTEGDLIGAGTFYDGKCGLAVWGDNKITSEVVEGLFQGEAFELKLWDCDRDMVVDLSAGAVKEGTGLTYTTDGFAVLSVKTDVTVPHDFYLSRPYPNPFNAVTCLSYDVPEAAQVLIKIYDLGGRRLTTLVSGEHVAGKYTAVWDAYDLASGVYILRMEAAGFEMVRKVLLVR